MRQQQQQQTGSDGKTQCRMETDGGGEFGGCGGSPQFVVVFFFSVDCVFSVSRLVRLDNDPKKCDE